MRSMIQARILLIAIGVLCFAPNYLFANEIFLIRHAEKEKDGTRDPSLTELGKQRAINIGQFLKTKNIEAIYSTKYKRTMQTAQPSADILGLAIKYYDPGKLTEFSEQLKALETNMLIVGHSNTTPQLTALLGGNAKGNIPELEFDRIYKLTFDGEKVTTKVLRSRPVHTIQ